MLISPEKIQKPSRWKTFAVFSAIFLFTYLPCFLASFGFLDDYFILFYTLQNGSWSPEIVGSMMAQGRPLNLPFITAAFYFIKDIDGLVFLRILATLGTAFLATLFFRQAMHNGWNRAQAFVLALLVFTQLPFQVESSWGLIGTLGAIRIPLAYVSYFIVKYACDSANNSPRYFGLSFAGFLTLAASMAMHQTGAMFFWVGLAQDTLALKSIEITKRLVATASAIFGLACISEYFVCQLGKKYYADYLLLDRDQLSIKVFEKLKWFFSEPITNSLNFNSLHPNSITAFGVAWLIALGLWFYARKTQQPQEFKLRASLLIILPFLCYLPNLLVAESWASYRTMYALSALAILYFFCAMQGLAGRLEIRQKVVTAAFGAAALLSLVIANQNTTLFMVQPQTQELALLRYRLKYPANSAPINHLLDQLTPPKGKGRFDIWDYDSRCLLPKWDEILAKSANYDEFGRSSSSRPYVGNAMVGLIVREQIASPDH